MFCVGFAPLVRSHLAKALERSPGGKGGPSWKGRMVLGNEGASLFLVLVILGGACESFIFDAMFDHVKHLIRAPSVFTTPRPQKKDNRDFVGCFRTNKTVSVVSCHVHVDC